MLSTGHKGDMFLLCSLSAHLAVFQCCCGSDNHSNSPPEHVRTNIKY